MKRLISLLALLVVTVVLPGTLRAQTKLFEGTWKLNLTKSKYEGAQAPKSLTRTVTAEGTGLKYSFEGEAADGSKVSYSFSSKLAGSESAVRGRREPDAGRIRHGSTTKNECSQDDRGVEEGWSENR